MTGAAFEVVWPLQRGHYLNPSLNDQETDMPEDVTPETPVSAPGRDLAARALLAGCTQQRVSALLETSRRSVGRAAETDLAAALQDPAVVAEARTVLADSARRGSSAEERDAAETWLAEALREERAIESTSRRTTSGRAKKKSVPKGVSTATQRPNNRTPPPAPPLAQLDVFECQQERIRHRTQVIAYVLTTEHRNGSALTLGDALTELLADINDAVQTIGTILHPVPSRRP